MNEYRKEIYLKKNTSGTQKIYHTTNQRKFIDKSTEMTDTSNSLTTTASSNHGTKTHKGM
jgi:hypothetical protein